MSAFPNNRAHVRVMLALLALSTPAAATIVFDGKGGRSPTGSVIERSMLASSSNAGYSVARSRAWMKYERGDRASGMGLVRAPLNGAWMSSSTSQFNARTHVARAQAYRLGDRE